MKNNYECYDATGEIVGSEDIGSGVCKIPRVGEASTKKVEDDDRCEVSVSEGIILMTDVSSYISMCRGAF